MRRGGLWGNMGELFRPLSSLQLCFGVDLSLSIPSFLLASGMLTVVTGNKPRGQGTKGAGGTYSGGGTGLVLLSNKTYSLTMGRLSFSPTIHFNFGTSY